MPPTIEKIQDAYNTILTGDLFQVNGEIVARLYPDTHGELRSIIKRSYKKFYEDSIKQSLAGNDIGSFKTLSEMNLERVRNYAKNVNSSELSQLCEAFRKIRFFWKTSRGERRFPSVMKLGKILSTTEVLGQYSRTVDDRNLWLPHKLGEPGPDDDPDDYEDDAEDVADKIKLANTNTGELHYREDGGFVFFRVETNARPPERTRYGTCSFIFDPNESELNFTKYGWVSLRDVFHPYSDEDFNIDDATDEPVVPAEFDTPERYKNIITVSDGTGPVAQRISAYSTVEDDKIFAINGGKLIPASRFKSVSELIYKIPNTRENRRNTNHYFLFQSSNSKGSRLENVLESMFVGEDMLPGIMYSTVRALHELPPLWGQALTASQNAQTFQVFIDTWLRRFYHIEGKYPVAVDVPNRKVKGLFIYQDGKPYKYPAEASSPGNAAVNPELATQTSAPTGTSDVTDFPK